MAKIEKTSRVVVFYTFSLFTILISFIFSLVALLSSATHRSKSSELFEVRSGVDYPLWEMQQLNTEFPIYRFFIFLIFSIICISGIALFAYRAKELIGGFVMGALVLTVLILGGISDRAVYHDLQVKENEALAQNFSQWFSSRYDIDLPQDISEKVIEKKVDRSSGEINHGSYAVNGETITFVSKNGELTARDSNGAELPISMEAMDYTLYGDGTAERNS